MIEMCGLTKRFGRREALAGVDLTVAPGESVALVGPNGAGKTTLLRVLATLTRPSAGLLRIAGLDPARHAARVRRQIGFLSHRTMLYADLTAEQNLHFTARMAGLAGGPARVDELLERIGLAHRRAELVRTLSHGMQQRLAVARAVLHRPALLLLDEPYAGLDPHAADTLTDLLADLTEEGCTVLQTTHDLARGLAPGRRVLVLARGRLVLDEPSDGIDAAAFAQTYRALTA